MFRFARHHTKLAPERAALPETVPAPTEMSGRRKPAIIPATIPATWPTGVSQLAIAVDACQRCDTAAICADWIKRTPNPIVLPPAFCPEPEAFRAKQAKGR